MIETVIEMAKKKKEAIPWNDIEIEELKYNIKISGFKSYQLELVDFLENDSKIQQKQKVNKTYIVRYKPTKQLVGYLTLSTASINVKAGPAFKKEFHDKFKELNINYKDLPALRVGRLCVHDDFVDKGIGTKLVLFSMLKILEINKHVGCRFLYLDAKRHDEPKKDSVHFYKKMGFKVYKERQKGALPMYFDLYHLIDLSEST